MGSDAHDPKPHQRLAEPERFRGFVDAAPDLLLAIELPSGKICDVNQTACICLGQNREALLGSTVSQWISKGQDQLATVLEQLLGDRDGSATMVADLIGPGNRRIPAEMVIRTVSRPEGCLAVIAARDVTDRCLAGQALREREARLKSIFRAAPTGIGVVADRVLLQVNERVCEMTGYSVEELIGRPSRMLYPTDEEFEYVGREKYRQIRESGTGTVETRWRRKDGTLISVLLSSAPIDPDDLSAGVTFTALDITARKLAEEAIEKRLIALTQPLDADHLISFDELFNLADIQTLQDLFADATGVASIITKPDGTPITRPSNFSRLCNDIIRGTAMGRTNCYHSDAVIGRCSPDGPIVQTCLSGGLWDAGASVSVGGHHIANWLIGQVRDESQDEENALQYASQIGADLEAYRAAFHEVTVMPRAKFDRIARMLFVLANQLSAFAYQSVQQARFITDQKRAEAEREALLAELEARNAELERFTYTVSHDLKSPLITIKGYLGVLEEDLREGNEQAVEDDLERIARSADTMATLLKNLLELSRIGRIVNPPTEVRIDELAREAVAVVAGLIAERGVQVEIQPDLPVARADRQRLLEVLQNLVENAVKYMGDQREPRIQIGAASSAGMVLVHVLDNGIGIEPKYHERIFGLFNQLNPASEGSGIGLALAKRIVEVHGGRIWVESEGNAAGSKFCFTVPAAAQPRINRA